MKNIYFHIGYPKAASTSLQKQLFDKHKDINFLGVYPTGNLGQDTQELNKSNKYITNNYLKYLHYNLTMIEGIEFFFSNTELIVEKIYSLLDKKKQNVFSNERITSVFFAHKDRAQKADRIKKLFPNARIILIIRNQVDIIKSQYRDYPFDPTSLYGVKKTCNINKWIEADNNNIDIGFLKSINYYEVVLYYTRLFGKENVGVFLFEEMVGNLQGFSKKISSFINIDSDITYELLHNAHENIGVSKNLNIYRKIKYIFLSILPVSITKNTKIRGIDIFLSKKLKKGKKERIEMNSETLKWVQAYFYNSNKKLENEFGLNLLNYKYYNEN